MACYNLVLLLCISVSRKAIAAQLCVWQQAGRVFDKGMELMDPMGNTMGCGIEANFSDGRVTSVHFDKCTF